MEDEVKKVSGLYPYPSIEIRHTVSYCVNCSCQRTFSYGICDHCKKEV